MFHRTAIHLSSFFSIAIFGFLLFVALLTPLTLVFPSFDPIEQQTSLSGKGIFLTSLLAGAFLFYKCAKQNFYGHVLLILASVVLFFLGFRSLLFLFIIGVIELPFILAFFSHRASTNEI